MSAPSSRTPVTDAIAAVSRRQRICRLDHANKAPSLGRAVRACDLKTVKPGKSYLTSWTLIAVRGVDPNILVIGSGIPFRLKCRTRSRPVCMLASESGFPLWRFVAVVGVNVAASCWC